MNEANIRTTLTSDSFLKSVESFPPTLQELCDLYTERVLDMCEDNRVLAARVLGIGRTTLYHYMRIKRPYRLRMKGTNNNVGL